MWILTVGAMVGFGASLPSEADNVTGIVGGQGAVVGSSQAFWSAGSGDAYLMSDNRVWNGGTPGSPSPELSLSAPTGGANPVGAAQGQSSSEGMMLSSAASTGGVSTSGDGGAVASTFGNGPVAQSSLGSDISVSDGTGASTPSVVPATLVLNPSTPTTNAALIDPATNAPLVDGNGSSSVAPAGRDPSPVSVPVASAWWGGLALLVWAGWHVRRQAMTGV